jgi:TPR repeat protein
VKKLNYLLIMLIFSCPLLAEQVNSNQFSPEQFAQELTLAEDGNATNQYNVAYAYHHGDGVIKNKEKALFWYAKAESSNKAAVRYKIGRLYETGDLLPQSIDKAVSNYQFAAKHNDPYAQANLGVLYMEGRGVEKDIDKGLMWITKAAEKYSLEAQVNLANFYRMPGKYQDLEKSIHWYGLAAEGNSGFAQMELGKYHVSIKKYDIAKRLFTQAVVNGMSEGNLMLAMMYDKGLGVDRDINLVKDYLSKAAEGGNEKAENMLKQLVK